MLTESERLFQQLCEAKAVSYERIEEEPNKTPDYFVDIEGTRIVIEIKEFEPNPDEEAILRDLSENSGKIHISSVTPGDAVRRKIKKAGAQIKRKSKGTAPSILVLHNRRLLENPTNAYEVRVAMYGFDAIVIAVPEEMSIAPYAIGIKSAGKRQMTETCNTSISAIGVLNQAETGGPTLTVYHNAYSAVPLSEKVAQRIADRQLVRDIERKGQITKL